MGSIPFVLNSGGTSLLWLKVVTSLTFLSLELNTTLKKNKQKGGTDEICGLIEFTEI